MAVTFTPNIGLAKVTESELALDWARGTQLYEDNNTILEDVTDINLITTTPAVIGATTNPNFGAGSVQLEYSRIQGFVFGTFVIAAVDPGVAPGTGTGAYGIALPFLADVTFHTVGAALNDVPGVASCIGEGYVLDASSIPFSGALALDIVHIAGVAYLRMITESFSGKTTAWQGPSTPNAIATGDSFTGTFCYKAV
jgi:hypothetical protein